MSKPKVGFICVHNSCRSQMAEAISKLYAADVFEAYSAGTETKPQINPDAVRIIKQLYDVDMTLTQSSKLIEDLPPVDVVITMGCGVAETCPLYLGMQIDEDWGLDDPAGKGIEQVRPIRDAVRERVVDLIDRIEKQKSW